MRHLLPGAAALAGTAGCINSVVLGFFRTPVSHVTDAVSHLGLDPADGRVADSLASSSIILGFVLGAMVAGLLVGALKRVPSRSYGVVILVEGALLAVATGLLMVGHLLGLPTVAMACGLQNAMTSSYCGLVIRTTHITRTVTDIGVMLGHWIRHRQIDRGKLLFLTCRRRFKTGFLAGTKADRWSEGEMAEDRGPNVLWRKFEDPETEAWMEHEGDGLAESGGDLIVAAVEVDGVVVVDAPGAAQ